MISKKKLLPVLLSVIMLCSCGSADSSEEEIQRITTTAGTSAAEAVTTVPASSASLPETTASAADTVTSSVSTAETSIPETVTVTEKQTESTPAQTKASEKQTEKKTEKITETKTETKAPEKPAKTEKVKGKTAEEVLAELTVEEKVGQLFMTRPDALIYNDFADHNVNFVTEDVRNALKKIPLGGVSFFGGNVKTPDQVRSLTGGLQDASRVPMILTVDEEGGGVARIGNAGTFPVTHIPSMRTVGDTGDPEEAYKAGNSIGKYLKEYGFNCDFAPVADTLTNPLNLVIGVRSFGTDPAQVTKFVSRCIDGIHANGVMTCLKHFPGHGGTFADTHTSAAIVEKTWDELKACDLIPFKDNLDKTDMVMVAHIALPKVTGDNTPASLSYEIMTKKLREELGFEGVIITDGLGMNAVRNHYSSSEAAVKSFLAGTDVLLIPEKIYEAYNGVLEAVRNGKIPMSRLDESVLRILKLKEKYGLFE